MSNSPPRSPKEQLIHEMRKEMLFMRAKYEEAQERITSLESLVSKSTNPLKAESSQQADQSTLPMIKTRESPHNDQGTPRSHEDFIPRSASSASSERH